LERVIRVLVIVAGALRNFPARLQFVNLRRRPRFCVRLRVLDCDIILQSITVNAADALADAQSVGVAKTDGIEPRCVNETN
jgi:hypothetical protein